MSLKEISHHAFFLLISDLDLMLMIDSSRMSTNVKFDQTLQIPHFDGSNWEKFDKELTKAFILLGVMSLIDGTATQIPKEVDEPEMPIPPTKLEVPAEETPEQRAKRRETDTDNFTQWQRENEIFKSYQTQWIAVNGIRANIIREWKKMNSAAIALLSQALPDGIYKSVEKLHKAKAIYNQLKKEYGKTTYATIMDNFNKIKSWKIIRKKYFSLRDP